MFLVHPSFCHIHRPGLVESQFLSADDLSILGSVTSYITQVSRPPVTGLLLNAVWVHILP